MTEVAAFVAEALAGRKEVEPIATGYRLSLEHGVTTLTFRPLSDSNDDNAVAAIATVETRFAKGAMPADFDEEGIAWLNRRAVFGSFFRDAAGLGCRLTYPLDKDDPGARWVAMHLLEALGGQLSYCVGIGQIEISSAHYRASRQAFGAPRHWTARLSLEAFEEIAAGLRQRWGFSAGATPSRLMFQVPLAAGAAARAADPEAEAAVIWIRTDVQHPLAGVGYCATLTLPRQPPRELLTMWCTQLNALEHEHQHLSPKLGAWAKRDLGRQIIYGMFWPVDQAGVNPATNLAHWMVLRAAWIGKTLWRPEVGLHLHRRDI